MHLKKVNKIITRFEATGREEIDYSEWKVVLRLSNFITKFFLTYVKF